MRVTRIGTKKVVTEVPVAFRTLRRSDSSLFEGTTKVVQDGRRGVDRRTAVYATVDGERKGKAKTTTERVTDPRPRVIAVGTKDRPAVVARPAAPRPAAPAARRSTPSAPAPPTSSSGGLDWAALARCESGGNPRVVSSERPLLRPVPVLDRHLAERRRLRPAERRLLERADLPRAAAVLAQRPLAVAALRPVPVAAGTQAPVPAEPVPSPLLTAPDVRRLAARLGTRPTKTLGQNFVIDPNTVRRIVRTAGVGADDVVVEVGPGLGSLTLELLEPGRPRRRRRDRPGAGRRAAGHGRRAAARPRGPARGRAAGRPAAHRRARAGRRRRSSPTCPYNVAVPVLLRLLEHLPSLRTGLVMVQAEVADRLVAPPGSRTYGVPSVKAAWYAEVRRAGSIGRTVFWPAPHVDSGLVAFTRREPPAGDRAATFAVVDAAFAQRRKTLRAALAGWAGSAGEAERRLVAAGIDPGARGEQLAVDDFARLAAVPAA